MPGDRRQILSLLRLPIPPLQRWSNQKVSIAPNFPQGGFRLPRESWFQKVGSKR